MNNLPVLIIGAGPTGLTLACELARRNIKIRIIERATEYHQGSRAKGMQPRSLEVMNDLGLANQLLDAGITDLIFRRYNGSQLLGDVKREIFPRSDTRYIQSLILPQWKVEEILRKKLATFGIQIELGTELVEFSQTEEHVKTVLQTPDGLEEVYCDYMTGCDGGKSSVRKMAGIKFEGETHEDERVFVGDVEVDGLSPDAWHVWLHPQLGFGFALCPFRCTSSWQVQAIAMPDTDGKLAEPGLDTFRKLFAERADMPGVTLRNATWSSLYRVNVRMADRFRVGRVFIAGDAAHAHSIAGGLGMNTGIQDAYNLGWKLALVINGTAKEQLLDTYEEERLPIAAWTLNISSERQKVLEEAIRLKGDTGLHTTATKDTTQLNLNYRYSSLSSDLDDEHPDLHAGDRAPDRELPDGRWLSDLYRGTHFTILRFSTTDDLSNKLHKQFGDKIKAYDMDGEVASSFGARNNAYIIRPDGYIGMIAHNKDGAGIDTYLQRFIFSL